MLQNVLSTHFDQAPVDEPMPITEMAAVDDPTRVPFAQRMHAVREKITDAMLYGATTMVGKAQMLRDRAADNLNLDPNKSSRFAAAAFFGVMAVKSVVQFVAVSKGVAAPTSGHTMLEHFNAALVAGAATPKGSEMSADLVDVANAGSGSARQPHMELAGFAKTDPNATPTPDQTVIYLPQSGGSVDVETHSTATAHGMSGTKKAIIGLVSATGATIVGTAIAASGGEKTPEPSEGSQPATQSPSVQQAKHRTQSGSNEWRR